MKKGTNIEKCKECKYAMILGIQNQKGHKYRKMQGMQICDDTGVEDKQWEATKIQRDTNIENARNTNIG